MWLEQRCSYRILLLTQLRSAAEIPCFSGALFHQRGFPSMLFAKIQYRVEAWSLFLTKKDANTRSCSCYPGGVVAACPAVPHCPDLATSPAKGGLTTSHLNSGFGQVGCQTRQKWDILPETLLLEMWRVTQAVSKLHVRDDTIGNQIKNREYFVGRTGEEGMAPI